MAIEMLWPAKGDRLFVESGSFDADAHITGSSVLTWISMAEGYARMAEIAVAHSDRVERNSLVYPVVFCYRHAVELYLKFAINVGRRLFEVRGNSRNRMKHRLWEIWLELRPFIKRMWPHSPDEDLLATEAMIKEFDQVDRDAQRFRFPISSKNVRHFVSGKCSGPHFSDHGVR